MNVTVLCREVEVLIYNDNEMENTYEDIEKDSENLLMDLEVKRVWLNLNVSMNVVEIVKENYEKINLKVLEVHL